MNTPRWLLPFTYGVDMRALDAVVGLAGSARATLVPVSLISVPHEGRSRGARLEHIQQSKDFLKSSPAMCCGVLRCSCMSCTVTVSSS